MKTSLIMLSLLFTLSACAFGGDAPFTPFEVDIEIPVSCHDIMPDEPEWALSTTLPESDIADQAKATLIEISQRQAYEDRLKAQLQACL